MQSLKRSRTYLRTICRSLVYATPKYAPIEATNTNENPRIFLESLEQRDLVWVRGQDAHFFLQGLITNDILHLHDRPDFTSMYTMFLNRSGRVLYDAIIYRAPEPNAYLIECDRSISDELRRHLRQFRVRRKIDIESADQDYNLWVAYNPQTNVKISTNFDPDVHISPDPRLHHLGVRILTKSHETLESLTRRFTNARQSVIEPPTPECNYRLQRYKLGVGEGVSELPPGKCFPLEANADYLHGISFQKGCYVGQELTARTFHTGVIRKRLMPLTFSNNPPAAGAEIQNEAGNKVGLLRAHYGKHGLAVLYIARALHAPALLINGDLCYAQKPKWWPAELPALSATRVSG